MLNRIPKAVMIILLLLVFFPMGLSAQTEKETKKSGLFPPNDPVSRLLMKTLFLPAKLVDTKTEVQPRLTEKQRELYNMEEIPITLDRDIALLVAKKNGKIEYAWSEQEGAWLVPDEEVGVYLQERYANREDLREKAKEHRTLKDMQKRLKEMTERKSRDLQRTDQTRR